MKLLSAIILIHSLLFAQDILTDISGRQARGQLIEVTETHVYRTSLFYIAKDPNLSSRNQGLSSVAGIGFEPMTSGL